MNHQMINSQPSHYSGITYCSSVFDTHFHNSYELICVRKGCITVTVNSHSIRLHETDFLLIPPCMMHSISDSNNSLFFIAIITSDYIPDFFEAHKRNEIFIFSVDDLSLRYLEEYLLSEKKQPIYRLKSCFYMILSFAEQGTCIAASECTNYEFASTVSSYVADHFAEPIKRSQLAEITGYEEHYFSNLFRKNFGLNLCQYVNLHRISFALKLLHTTDASISQVAIECGFSSVKEFNSVFLRQMNETPSQYRKKQRKENQQIYTP